MTDPQRAASALNSGNVFWDGPNVKIASGYLTGGRDAATGRVALHTPASFSPGSSISHFSTAAAPNLLMEPNINAGLAITGDLARQQMRDIGWFRDTAADASADTITGVAPNSGNTVVIGTQQTVSWANSGIVTPDSSSSPADAIRAVRHLLRSVTGTFPRKSSTRHRVGAAPVIRAEN